LGKIVGPQSLTKKIQNETSELMKLGITLLIYSGTAFKE
jgi:hypothetical protein